MRRERQKGSFLAVIVLSTSAHAHVFHALGEFAHRSTAGVGGKYP
jgi:hypothetical protein